MVTLLRRLLRTLLSSGMTTHSGLPASANKIDSWTPPTWTMWVTPKISTVACSKDTDHQFSVKYSLSTGYCHTLFSLVADSLKTKLDIESKFQLKFHQKVDPSTSGGCFGWVTLAFVGHKRIFLETNRDTADQKHCVIWRRESGSEFHKTSPMCKRRRGQSESLWRWRKQLRDCVTQSLSQTPGPLGSGTISSTGEPFFV